MKRNTSFLNKEDWKKIEEWLKDLPSRCPGILCGKCHKLFPETPRCPCSVFSYKYVTSEVMEILEQRGK